MSTIPLLLAIALSSDTSDWLVIERIDNDPRRVRVIASIPEEIRGKIPRGHIGAETAEPWLRFALMRGKDLGPAMFGTYRREGDKLIFTPRYSLEADEASHTYRAVFAVSAARRFTRDYVVSPRKPTRPAVVEAIYPTADVLPANHLKFYIHFSQPMREGRAIFDQIRLLGEDGKPVLDAWRRTELWTADARRFTLWIHPGRVKRGVNLREEFGPVLEPGKRYRLVIRAEVCDSHGQPLGKAFEKRFTTTAEDDARPLPQRWKLTAPTAGTVKPVTLAFGEPLDHALLHRCLQIRDDGGKPLRGRIEVGKIEATWSFIPSRPWSGAKYTIVVDPILEDLAGNTPERVFDTDLRKTPGEPPRRVLTFRPEVR